MCVCEFECTEKEETERDREREKERVSEFAQFTIMLHASGKEQGIGRTTCVK